MSKFIFPLLAIVLLHNSNLFSQNSDSVHVLSEVSISAYKDKYTTGSKVVNLDSSSLSNFSGRNLSDVLSFYMSLYIKQDAGGMATIRFRGSSPDHTAILYSGININSLTLGQSNLSEIPTFLFDNINIQFGGSGSLHGSDAIGGSIDLDTKVKWNNGFNIGVQQDYGSFGNYFSGIKTSFSNKKLFVSLKAFQHENKNNFPFLNTAKIDIITRKYKQDTAINAGFLNKGFLQEFSYKFSNNLISHFKLWVENNYHEAQPIMSSNDANNSSESIENQNIRLLSGIKYIFSQHKINLDFGYVKDYQAYNKNDKEIISTNSVLANIDYFNNNLFEGDFNSGINIRQIKPEVYAYQKDIEEVRFDFFTSYKRKFFKKLDLTLNLRDAIVTNYKNHFTPSLGIEYLLLKKSSNLVLLKSSFSHSYKVPTLNQRFWGKQGNPNILPESGNNYEFGVVYNFFKNSIYIKSTLTAYQMYTQNLIQWVNINDWIPLNVEDVNNKGIEWNIESSFNILKLKISNGISYCYTQSIVEKTYNESIFPIGKQLAYTPEHLGNAFVKVNFKTWELFCNTNYIGERHTLNNHNEKPLEEYFLVNTYINKNFVYKIHSFNLQLRVNNIMNIDYQNQKDYAMPGINYLISIKYFLTIKNKTK